MDRQPRRAPLGKAGGEVVSAAGVGNRNRDWNRCICWCSVWSTEIHGEHVAQAVPGEPGLLRIGAPPFRVHPVTSGVDTLFVGGREAEGREFRSSVDGPLASPARIAEMQRLAEYEAILARKYLHAARYPWLPVPPDPPPPE